MGISNCNCIKEMPMSATLRVIFIVCGSIGLLGAMGQSDYDLAYHVSHPHALALLMCQAIGGGIFLLLGIYGGKGGASKL
jgi:hypothetical protein